MNEKNIAQSRETSSKTRQNVAGKLNREAIVIEAARRAGTTVEDMTEYMNTIENVIRDAAKEGKIVSLIGFGTFYVQRHKGHPIQFAKDVNHVKDYLVYKFSAADVWNETLRELDRQHPISIVPYKKTSDG